MSVCSFVFSPLFSFRLFVSFLLLVCQNKVHYLFVFQCLIISFVIFLFLILFSDLIDFPILLILSNLNDWRPETIPKDCPRPRCGLGPRKQKNKVSNDNRFAQHGSGRLELPTQTCSWNGGGDPRKKALAARRQSTFAFTNILHLQKNK